MKKRLLLSIFIVFSMLGHANDPLFFLSSEKIVQEKQGPLKGIGSFTFFPLLKVEEKNAKAIVELIEKELKNVGLVVKKTCVNA